MSASSGSPDGLERTLLPSGGSAAGIFSPIEDRLAAVEALFRESLASPVAIIREIGSFVASGGGKRVRPALHLLTARLVGYEGPHDVLLATVLEFIHSSTLIHDDIIDEARTRRGRPSVNSAWGNNVTVLFGDYMFAKAMEMALRADSLRIMRKLAELTLGMTEGEMLQTRYVGRIDLSRAEYLGLIEKKTAVLFAGCCETAGILAGVDPEAGEALRRYGLSLGLAFQVVDDVLDFTSDAATLGKPAASDLREGKVTLPLIDLLETGPERARGLAKAVMTDGSGASAELGELTALLVETGAIGRALDEARGFADAALAEVRRFPESPERRALETLPRLIVSRNR